MLLIISLHPDETYELVTRYLTIPFKCLYINQDPFHSMSYDYSDGKFSYFFDNTNLLDVSSVWYRIARLTYSRRPKNEPYWLFNRLSREEMIKMLYGLLPNAKWCSNPYAIERAENKVLQMEVASKLDMHLPATLITSEPNKAIKFRNDVGLMIVKPLAKEVVEDEKQAFAFFTSRITPEMKVDFTGLAQCPAIFQQEIIRECDVRTIVIGEKVFSMAIHQVGDKKGGVDWRIGGHKDLEFSIHSLPCNLENQCIKLTKALDLKYGALDFVLGKDGNYYFLEINPTGEWAWFEIKSGVKIRKALINRLTK